MSVELFDELYLLCEGGAPLCEVRKEYWLTLLHSLHINVTVNVVEMNCLHCFVALWLQSSASNFSQCNVQHI